ncbi:MAG: PAS domain-containing sensor histidine kinase, partial [bacterium]|nr:PAS domain-containing sensor histidine kinase [bacterium]
KIFDPFFSTKTVGEGTGLGLAICHRIVSEHDGTIDVESNPDMGTTFVIRIPVKKK